MQKRARWMATGAIVAAAAVVAGSGAVAAAAGDGGGDGGDRPISGPALVEASAVALHHIGGGRVTATEIGDEESYYQVEVTRSDGSQVDVQLDRHFKIVGSSADREGPGHEGAG